MKGKIKSFIQTRFKSNNRIKLIKKKGSPEILVILILCVVATVLGLNFKDKMISMTNEFLAQIGVVLKSMFSSITG